MSEAIKRNFEPGRLLLIVTVLMSLTLISQLYVISESMDLSNGIQFTGIELSLTASYLFTALSMVIVINEFFQIKSKFKGLMDLSSILSDMKLHTSEILDSQPSVSNVLTQIEHDEEKIEAMDLDGSEFDKFIESELKDVSNPDSKYTTQKVKIEDSEEIKPLIEDGELKNIFDEIEEETEMDRMLAESEVIKTLNELEGLVQELKITKKSR